MNYQVVITSRAKSQLSASAHWWAAHRSIEQAERWLDGFEQALAGLAENPQPYPTAPENDLYDLPYPVQQLLYGIGKRLTHRAVFEVRQDTVFVVAIRHLAQDDLSPEML